MNDSFHNKKKYLNKIKEKGTKKEKHLLQAMIKYPANPHMIVSNYSTNARGYNHLISKKCEIEKSSRIYL